MSDTREVLLKLSAQFSWKGADLKPLAQQAKDAQQSFDRMKTSAQQAGAAIAQTAGPGRAGSGGTRSAQERYGVYDRAAIAQYEVSLRSLTRAELDQAAATRKSTDAERDRQRAIRQGKGEEKAGAGMAGGIAQQFLGFNPGRLGGAGGGLLAMAALSRPENTFGDLANVVTLGRGIASGGSTKDFMQATAGGWSPGVFSSVFREFFEGMQNLIARIRGVETPEDFGRRAAVEGPIVREQRSLAHTAYSMGGSYALDRAMPGHARGIRTGIENRGYQRIAESYAATPALNIVPGAAMAYQQTREQWRGLAEGSSQRLTGADKNVASAVHERTAALRLYKDALAQAASYNQENVRDVAKLSQLMERVRETAVDYSNAEAKVNDSLRARGAVVAENMRAERDFHREQKNRYLGIAAAEGERGKDLAATFGAMDPLKQFTTAALADKLAKAKEGKLPIGGPQVRFVNGRPVLMPGAGGGLSSEELQEAAGNPFLHNQYREYMAQATKGNPLFQKILQFEGQPQRQQQATQQAVIEAKAEATIDAKITLDETSLGKQLEEQFLPKVINAINQAIAGLQRKLQIDALANSVNQKHLGGGEF